MACKRCFRNVGLFTTTITIMLQRTVDPNCSAGMHHAALHYSPTLRSVFLRRQRRHISIGADIGGSPDACPPIIERPQSFHQLLQPFPPIYWFAPNIFDKSKPVGLYTVCVPITIKPPT